MVEARLHSYLCVGAERDRAVVSLPSFSLYVHLTDTSPEANYALPQAQPQEEWRRSVLALRHEFVERQRLPCVRFLESLAPTLARELSGAGFVEVQRASVMVCAPETLRPPPVIPGLTLLALSSASPFEDAEAGWNLNALGFDPAAAPGTPEEVETFRRSLVTSRAFIARLNGQGVGAAQNAFAQGIQLAFLVADNQQAGRVYERIGFRHVTNLVEWRAS